MRNPLPCGPVVLAAALLLGHAARAAAAETPTLESGLLARAPALVRHFQAKKYRNVGVLKFLVARPGDRGFSDNVGTLNMLLARRLEVALVLANDPKAPVGIIRNASAVAARTTGASHRSPAGRKKLFEPDYPLAWGKRQVRADAFVTGIAQVSKDLRTLTVSLLAFGPDSKGLTQLGSDFVVRNDAGKLAEMGQSFVLRGGPHDDTALAAAARTHEGDGLHPLQQSSPPVRLVVLYDGKPVRIEFRDGKAFLPEPRAEQKVAFRLVRDDSKVRYGVVLKVNGENTADRQRGPDLHCSRWVLAPGARPITITGYQVDDDHEEPFRVLSRAESKRREVNYGEDVGTITLTVFRQQTREPEPPGPDEARQQKRLQAVAQARLPGNKEDFQALKSALLAEAIEERGLIVPGSKVKSRTRTVEFRPAPTPVMTATLFYYSPKR